MLTGWFAHRSQTTLDAVLMELIENDRPTRVKRRAKVMAAKLRELADKIESVGSQAAADLSVTSPAGSGCGSRRHRCPQLGAADRVRGGQTVLQARDVHHAGLEIDLIPAQVTSSETRCAWR